MNARSTKYLLFLCNVLSYTYKYYNTYFQIKPLVYVPHAFHFTLIKDTSHNFIYFEPCHPRWCKVALMLFHIKLIIKRRDRDRRPEPLCRVPRALYEDYRGSPSRITLQKKISSIAACLRNGEHQPFSAKLDSHYFSLKVSFYNRQT